MLKKWMVALMAVVAMSGAVASYALASDCCAGGTQPCCAEKAPCCKDAE